MQILLRRKIYTEISTIGTLTVDGRFECYSLEDRWRPKGVKIPKESCIPAGEYRVILDYSPKRKRLIPHVLDVRGWSRIQLHVGNTREDTEGCILVGQAYTTDRILRSTLAFNAIYKQIETAATEHDEVWLTIKDDEVHRLPEEG